MLEENLIIIENRREGTNGWELTNPATSGEIEGYASATSVNRGDSISLFVNTGATSFSLQVYRMGWYQGLGARLVFSALKLVGTVQPMPEMDLATGLVDCVWTNPFVLTTSNTSHPQNWLSGIYLVKLTESAASKQSYIIFAVREECRSAALLMQQSVTTYQAYNNWGGKSLYKWGSTDNKRACKVSFNRPYAKNSQNLLAAYGVGAGEFLCNVQPHNADYPISNAGWEYNMLRWLEREGYDVAYCTNMDIHVNPDLLLNYRTWLSVGHDEYWSWEMRGHIENAIGKGVHLGFFSANTGYWQVRFESSEVSGQADRTMVCYKSASRDPYAKLSQQPYLTTCKWRDEPINHPEAKLIGVMYAADPVDDDIVVCNAQHWVFKDTGLANGAKLSGLLGYEVDCIQSGSPDTIEILAESPWAKLNDRSEQGIAHMTLYQTASGALVFAAGTIQWSWGLDDFNVPSLRVSSLNPSVQQITHNILNRFVTAAGWNGP